MKKVFYGEADAKRPETKIKNIRRLLDYIR